MPDALSQEQLEHFKQKLADEKVRVARELESVGRINPNNPKDWEAEPEDMDVATSDASELADKTEEFEGNSAILNELEVRFNQIERALEKIATGTYGRCEVGGEAIPLERLEANPAAMTCIQHADELRPE